LMTEANDPDAWERRYRHGVQASWEFAPEPTDGEPRLPSTVRGSIIHGVLERIEAEEELGRILEETIGSLDEPELETMLGPGSAYREKLEEEIRRVVSSEEWAWYTAGEPGRDYWKELTFTHLVGRRDWRFGAFDLYRRLGDGAPERLARALELDEGLDALVIDFKTHRVTADRAKAVARDYAIQADVYRAAAAIAGRPAVGLHFTEPNDLVPMREGVTSDET
ncbi:MAG: PD-(D/E)XK nuclease family protein, partial [Gemmatimonadota bacterium]|nr:PD-(D/E)XK nuclease family protein [Gemmatimonadota bacterium]